MRRPSNCQRILMEPTMSIETDDAGDIEYIHDCIAMFQAPQYLAVFILLDARRLIWIDNLEVKILGPTLRLFAVSFFNIHLNRFGDCIRS